MDWESRRRKRQEMGGAASGNTSANVESSNSIADAWERRRAQRLQMDAGSEEARRQRSEEVDRINQERKDQRSLELAQDIALGIVRSVANHWIHPYRSSQADLEWESTLQERPQQMSRWAQMEANAYAQKQREAQRSLDSVQKQIDEIENDERAGAYHPEYQTLLKQRDELKSAISGYGDQLKSAAEKRSQIQQYQAQVKAAEMQSQIAENPANFMRWARMEADAYQKKLDETEYDWTDNQSREAYNALNQQWHDKIDAANALHDFAQVVMLEQEAAAYTGEITAPQNPGKLYRLVNDKTRWASNQTRQQQPEGNRGADSPDAYMSETQRNTFNYLAGVKGEDAAEAYYALIKPQLEAARSANTAAEWAERTEEHPYLSTVTSVLMSPLKIPAGLASVARASFGVDVNTNDALHQVVHAQNAIRQTAPEVTNWTGDATIFGQDADTFIYGTITSALDSALNMVISGAITGAAGAAVGGFTAEQTASITSNLVSGLMGAEMLPDTIMQEKAKGRSDSEAVAIGIIRSLVEGITEKYSVEAFLSDPRGVAKRLEKAFVAEGSEEVASNWLNRIVDIAVKDPDNLKAQYDRLKESGAASGDALTQVIFGAMEEDAGSFLAGGISGMAMGGSAELAYYTQRMQAYTQQGQKILDSGNYDTLQALAMDVAKEGVYGKGESELSRFAEKTTAGVKNLNENRDSMTQRQVNRATRNVGKLADRVDTVRQQQNAADIQAMLEKKGMSARDAKKAAQLISENYEGLVDPEDKDLQRVMAKPEVRETMKEIADDSNSSVAKRNYRYNLGLMGLKLDENGVVVPVRSKTEEPAAESVTMAEADKNASVEISDGVSGKMQGIKWDNGILTATVTTEAGETVSAPVEDVSMPSEMQDLVAVSKQFGESAPAVYAAYQPGMGVAEYGAAMKLASDYGYTGVSRSYADSSEYLNGLHPAQISIAYEAGQAAWTKESTEIMRSQSKGTVFANRKAGKVSMKGGTVDGVTYKAVDRSGMTAQQKAAVRNITRLAQVTGINFVFYQSEKNSEGKYSGANGIYTDNTIFLDINAGATDSVTEAAILRTAAHELTHFIEQFSKSEYRALQEFMLKNLEGYKGKTIDQLVAEKQARSKKDMSFPDAMSEIVADGCEMMLQDTRIMELLASEHEGIAKKISRWLKNWVKDLKAAFTGVEAVHEEAKAMIAHAEELQKLWDNALMQALRNREQNADTLENVQESLTPGEEGTVYAENGDPVAHATEDGSVQLSMRTYEEEGRDAFRNYLEKCVSSDKLTKAEMQEMIDGIEEIYQVCKQFKDKYAPFGAWSDAAVIRDTYGKPVFSVVTPNGEYKMNLDFSLVCKKRRTLDAVFNEMSRRGIIDDFELGQKSVVKINEIIRKHGFETACALCFVDAKRFRQASMADSFVNLYNELVESLVPEDQRGRIGSFNFAGNDRVADVSGGIDTWSDSDLDFSHIDSVMEQYGKGTVEYKSAKYIKENAEARRLLQRGDFMSSKGFDAVKSKNRNILSLYNSKKGTGGPKAAFGDVQYMNEVIRKSRHWTPAKAYAVGGVRIQSFSDYVPRMVFDYVQMVYDLAATKLPAHAYTKEALFAKQFGLTGVKINMSLIPAIAKGGIAAGLDANGDYVWAGESFDFETAKEIQNAEGYTENCGTICVGVSDLHIRKLLSDPNIRMVIPYHKSGLNPIVAHMNRIAEFTDYTGSQNTLDKNGKKVEKDFDFNRALHKMGANGDPKAVVSEYLDWCDRQGYTPRFSQFRDNPNYYKLIEDFTLYDRNGQYVPQREVRAVFPTEGSAFGSMKALIEAGLQEDAVIEGKRDKSLSSIVDEIERTLPKTEAEIAETEVVQADRDLESDIKYSDRDLSEKQKEAVKLFGTTTDFNEAGYILPDGSMLRLTDDEHSGSRTYDHRAIGMVYGVDVDLNKNHGFNMESGRHMNSFVEDGSIRFDPGDPEYDMDAGIQLSKSKPISTEQEQTIRNFIAWKKARDESYAPDKDIAKYFGAQEPVALTIEFGGGSDIAVSARSNDLRAWGIDHLSYEGGQISADRVISDIRHYYATGEIRKPSEVAMFHYQDRDYSYEALTAKPDMTVTLVDDTAPKNRADIIHQAKKNAAGVGTFDPKTGSVSVRVNDINTDVILATNGLKHSMDRRTEVNGPVVVKAGEILQNSIRINELTPQKADAQESYVLIGAAQNNSGELYVVRSVINRFSNELPSMDVLYAINAKKESAALNAPRLADESAIRTDSTISISELLDYVNRYFPDVLPESVLKHYGYDARPEGKIGESALFQDRDTDSISNRALLANALESAAQNDIERKRLEEYRGKIDLLNSEEQKLQAIRSEIRELSFAKGPKDTKRIRDLQFEANKTANRINIIDRQLLRLEAAAPLQNVLQREKKLAYKRAEQKGKEALAAYREKATKTQREIISRYQESRAKGIDSRKRTAMRGKIKNVVNELNNYLLKGTKDRHVPESLRKAVAEALDTVNMDTVGAEERIAKLQQEMMKAKTPEKIQEIARKIDHIREMDDKMSDRLKKLQDAYDDIRKSPDENTRNSYDEVIYNKLESVIDKIGDTPLRNMTLTQLEDVYDMYRMVLTAVRDVNKSFKDEKKRSISVRANEVMSQVEEVGGKRKPSPKALNDIERFGWNNLKPVYAFEHIGSQTLTEAFRNVRKGEDVWAVDVTEAREFYLDKSRKYHYDSWDFNKQYTFTSTSGMDFRLNLEQILSLYAYSKRKQAADHLKYGGIVFDPNTEVVKTTKHGIKVTYDLNDATAYNINEETLGDIIGKLTDEQKAFADEMQDYLSTVMGSKGNEVSMEMYGIRLFREQNYFPLKSAQQFMEKARDQAKGEVKIKNSGFSKETAPKAKNPIVLSGFMDVWASHVNDMSMYHAFVLPMEDFYRIYNYKTPSNNENQATEGVNQYIENAYGRAATAYIDQLLKDLNGGARTDPRADFVNKMMGKFKKGAVFASASVVIQQPSAIARATALVDAKYFIGPKIDSKRHKALWEEVKQYAPVAIIKEMGYFDTNMGKSTEDFITGREYSGIHEKAKAMVSDSNYRDEVLSRAPALADEIAWCGIWEAVKRETKEKHPGLDTNAEPFLKLCGDRFTEVITKTQVYDSVLSRSALMRSKDTGAKMVTAFMAEPTTSLNMIVDALVQGKRGNVRYCRTAIGSVIAAQILNSILVSFVYAARDDDDDETYLEKYIGSVSGAILDGLNPLTYIPFIKDIVSVVKGYDVERADMSIVSDIMQAWENLSKDTVTPYRKVEGFAGSIANLFGLPVKNIMRDARSIYQVVSTFMNGQKTSKGWHRLCDPWSNHWKDRV